jgi:hypothetical protein
VFEIAKTANGYASTPTTLVSFNATNGAGPFGSLIADAHGDLFGTTAAGGANGGGTVFEGGGTVFDIAKTAPYASTPGSGRYTGSCCRCWSLAIRIAASRSSIASSESLLSITHWPTMDGSGLAR